MTSPALVYLLAELEPFRAYPPSNPYSPPFSTTMYSVPLARRVSNALRSHESNGPIGGSQGFTPLLGIKRAFRSAVVLRQSHRLEPTSASCETGGRKGPGDATTQGRQGPTLKP